ncbi:hypothetical protein CERSUDRAFT_136935, partial [Gelatoporia subvermispora B]
MLSTRVDALKATLDGILASAEENQRSRFHQMFWFAETDKKNLESIGQRIEIAMSNFKFQRGIAVERTLDQIAADIKNRYLLEVDKEARGALNSLNPANASYTSALIEEKSRLQAGTREAILHDLAEWAKDDKSDKRLYVLYGQAGMGKSSIAQAFCRQLPGRYLGASFFFLRSSTECSDAHRVFPTIAYQLAESVPSLRPQIANAAQKHKAGHDQALEHQIRTLILGILRNHGDSAITAPTLVFVVDGVDECTNTSESIVPSMLQ